MELLPSLVFIMRWLKEGGTPCRQRLLCMNMPSSCCACTGRAGHDLLDMPVCSRRWGMPSKLGLR